MRIKIILYVIIFTYTCLVLIKNNIAIRLDFIFGKFNLSFIIIVFGSILLGLILGLFGSNKKVSKLKKEIKELKASQEVKEKK